MGQRSQDLDALLALGVFVRRGVIEPDLCRDLRSAARVADHEKATIVRDAGGSVVDERHRRTRSVDIPHPSAQVVSRRIAALGGELSGYFDVDLSGCQETQFLLYRRGDFFRAHADNSGAQNLEEYIRLRQISVVVFLSDQASRPTEDAYCGGELRFFMLDRHATAAKARTSVRGEAGLVVAFRSHTFHEVAPVSFGERLTAVTWMVGPRSPGSPVRAARAAAPG
ncbi:MAG TPA: 2OG-Fe(II) oxygenase [Solirubrobacteraceae bacterium]|nr:2OG-Fe(II) oxygenase [Solirubrobacteraceae bacterium]